MNSLKILIHSNAAFVGSGYGQQTGLFSRLLTQAGHHVIVSAFYGLRGVEMTINGVRHLPGGLEQYGNDLLRVPATHKDGRAMSIAFTVAMLFNPDQSVKAVVAIIRDETQRFNDDRALRKRLADAEARIAAAGTP